jgi:hypothetical protein
MVKNKEGGAGMADTKLFHPTIECSKLCEPVPDGVEMAEIILHDLGWLTQQGLFEEAVARLRWLAENKKTAFLRGCATGLSVCRNSLQ